MSNNNNRNNNGNNNNNRDCCSSCRLNCVCSAWPNKNFLLDLDRAQHFDLKAWNHKIIVSWFGGGGSMARTHHCRSHSSKFWSARDWQARPILAIRSHHEPPNRAERLEHDFSPNFGNHRFAKRCQKERKKALITNRVFRWASVMQHNNGQGAKTTILGSNGLWWS